MNLIIDQGNTVCKVAVAAQGRLVQHYTYPHLSLREAGQVLSAHPDLEAAVYSSVARVDKPLLGLLSERLHSMIKVDETTAIPLEVAYDRKRLGSDRLAAVVGAYSLAPREATYSSSTRALRSPLSVLPSRECTSGGISPRVSIPASRR